MSKPITSSIRLLVVAAISVVAITACSSSKASSAGTPAPGAASSTNAVTIKDYAFSPKAITVKAGTKVTWTNDDEFAHAIKDSTSDQDGSMNIDPSKSYSHTYTKAGTYPYVCAIHPNMHGTVTVTAS